MDIRSVPTFVINLDHNKDRLTHAIHTFEKLGIPLQRFPAIYGKKLDRSYLDSVIHPYVWYTIENGPTSDPDINSLGAVGCSLSHIGLWQKLASSSEDVFHIIEDDACIKASDLKHINSFLSEVDQIDPDWDVIYVGYNPSSFIYGFRQIQISPTVQKVNAISFGAQSYLLRKKGAQKLLEKAFPIFQHVDNYMSIMAIHGGLRSYRPTKSFVSQPTLKVGDMTSNISNLACAKTLFTRFPMPVLAMSTFISIFAIVYFIFRMVFK